MKRNITVMAATILFALTFASCSWFNRNQQAPTGIEGSWRLDSAVKKGDSSADAMPAILMALAAGDSAAVTYTFTGDSLRVATHEDVLETVAYRYEKPVVTLLDSSSERFDVLRPSDSALVLRTADSARMYFSRQ